MGFGHRVYRAEDPRARVLRRTAEELGAPRFEAAEALEKAALEELRERRPDRPIETNVEFWAAIVLDFAEVPPPHVHLDVHLRPHRRLVRAHPRAEAHRPPRPPVGPLRRARPAQARRGRGLGHHHDQDHDAGRAGLNAPSGSRPDACDGPARHDARPERHSRMSITIPAELLPADGRFGCGPSKVRPEALQALAADGAALMGTSHRQAPVKDLVRRVRDGLATLFALPDGYEVVLGNGGTTAFWDAALFGLVRQPQRARHLRRVLRQVRLRGRRGAVPRRPGDRQGRPGHAGAARRRRPGVDVYALGAQRDLDRRHGPGPPARGRRRRALVLIDATSGAGGLPVDVAQTDVYYFAPQKSFASDGGLWIALMSPDALERVAEIKASGRWIPGFLDLSIAVDNSTQGPDLQHPGGRHAVPAGRPDRLDARPRRALAAPSRAPRDSSSRLYGWAEKSEYATPFVADPAQRSLVVGTIDFADSVDAAAVAKIAAGQRHRRHRAVPQAGPQPAAGRHVPGRRPRRRERADRLHRLRGRAPLRAGPVWSASSQAATGSVPRRVPGAEQSRLPIGRRVRIGAGADLLGWR